LSSLIEDAKGVDRSGSVVFEHILCLPDNIPSGFEVVQLKELVVVSCWYLWWLRRRRTHGEIVPPIHKCNISILTITSNSAKSAKPIPLDRDGKWQRPDPRVQKLNIDASFYVDSRTGSTGVVIHDYKGSFVAASCRS
jgi:hypothetical protein